MTIQEFTKDKIHDNPYQKRPVSPASVKELGANIKQYGLQHKPKARPHPTQPGHIELIEGHRRTVAWFSWAFPSKPIPIDLQEGIDDRRMFELNVIENFHREPPTPIQMAIQIQAYIDEFQVSQAEAGKVFNLNTQGAVSNKLGLLKLPGKVQGLLEAGRLSERIARSLVVPVRIDAKKVMQIVDEALADDENRDPAKAIEDDLGDWAYRTGKELKYARWDRQWAPAVAIDGQTEARACKGCPFIMRSMFGSEMCMQSKCYSTKRELHAQKEILAASKKLGIAIKKDDEKVQQVWAGYWERTEKAKGWVKNKLAHLRLAYCQDNGGSDGRKQVLGTPYAGLYTTDKAWLEKVVADEKKKERSSAYSPERMEAEKKAKAECVRQCYILIDQAAPTFAIALPVMPAALFYVIVDEMAQGTRASDIPDKKFNALKADQLRLLFAAVLLENYLNVTPWYSGVTVKECERMIGQLAREAKIKLPRDWNVIGETNGAAPVKKSAKPKGKKK